LDPAFARALDKDPILFVRIARALLETNFPKTLHDDLIAQVGLNLDEPEVSGTIGPPAARRRRDPVFRDMVLMAYEYRCAVCGWDGQLGAESVGLEAAHLRWFTIGGPDDRDNGLCLCSLHHKLLDKGVIGITRAHTVAVSARFVGRGIVADQLVLGFLGKDLAEPQPGLPLVADAHIDWHLSQVFRGPHRKAAAL
jgi:putative restriction endonuclease